MIDNKTIWYDVRRTLRAADTEVVAERFGYLPGHQAIVLGRAMEAVVNKWQGLHMVKAASLLYAAAKTI